MTELFKIIIDNGAAIGVLAYLLYRDNKFMNSIVVTMTKMQTEIEHIMEYVERGKNNE